MTHFLFIDNLSFLSFES